MTPLPKYLAVSKAHFGTLDPSHFVRLDSTGNNAPKDEPTRMTKIEAIRSERLLSSPPPEPQLVGASSSFGTNREACSMGVYIRCGKPGNDRVFGRFVRCRGEGREVVGEGESEIFVWCRFD